MTVQTIKVLVIDRNSDAADELIAAYRAEFEFETVDYVSSTHKAVQSLLELECQLCLVADVFPEEDLASFFKDVLNESFPVNCAVVQVCDEVTEEFDFEAAKAIGFHASISRKGTHADRERLTEALKEFSHEEQVKAKVVDVSKGLDAAMRAIDRVAESMKRGSKHMLKLDMLARDFIRHQTNFADEVLDKYYDKLADETDKAQPNEIVELDVPEEVIKKQLPGLSSENYQGASHRVWTKLKDEYGLKAGEERKHKKLELPESASASGKPKKSQNASQRLQEKLAMLGADLEQVDFNDSDSSSED